MISNAERILTALNGHLDCAVELTLFGRAALQLGFDPPAPEFAQSRDIDAVLWVGQAEELLEKSNFWPAVEKVNADLEADGLYVSHFFEEDQVVLTPVWKEQRAPIENDWKNLRLYRLGNGDLLLSKLMRDDPQDQFDAGFIVERSRFSADDIRNLISRARIPDSPEIHASFEKASARLLAGLA